MRIILKFALLALVPLSSAFAAPAQNNGGDRRAVFSAQAADDGDGNT